MNTPQATMPTSSQLSLYFEHKTTHWGVSEGVLLLFANQSLGNRNECTMLMFGLGKEWGRTFAAEWSGQ